MQEHLVAAQLIDEAWSHPGGGKNKDRENGFPEEHIVPSDETAPFGRIFVDGDHLLLSNQRRRGFSVVDSVQRKLLRWTAESVAVLLRDAGDLQAFSNGYMLFKVTRTHYALWRRIKEAWTVRDAYASATAGAHGIQPDVSFVASIILDATCTSLRFKDDWLMMTTGKNILHGYYIPSAHSSSSSTSTSTADGLSSSFSIDFTTLYPQDIADDLHTTSINFDSRYIFHCTNYGIWILSRENHSVLFRIHDTPWKKVAPKKWTKCITSNSYIIPGSREKRRPMDGLKMEMGANGAPVQVKLEEFASPPVYEPRNEKVKLERGSTTRSDRWFWNVLDVVLAESMAIFNLGDGWILGIPDYRAVVEGTKTVEDGCWAVDLGSGSACSGIAFDGRRLICTNDREISILNLHDVPNYQISPETEMIRISQRDCVSTGAEQNLVLTDTSLWFLARDAKDWCAPTNLAQWRIAQEMHHKT